MNRQWIRENPPHWDQGKAEIIGGAPAGIFDFARFRPGDLLPGEWWRVDEGGRPVGYGWMETTWGDGEILLAVRADAQKRGLGTWLLDQLEHEARAAGLNYIHNVVRPTHPEAKDMTRWLERRGFAESGDGRLKRRVGPNA